MPELSFPSESELKVLVDQLKNEASQDSREAVYILLGVYAHTKVPMNVKKDIKAFLINEKYWGSDIAKEMNISRVNETEEWMERFKKHSKMKKQSDIDASNPIVLKAYLENFKNIMKRQMPNVSDEALYQDAFNQMIDLLLLEEQKHDEAYLNKIVDMAKTFEPPIVIEVPTPILMEIRRKESIKVEKEESERAEKERKVRIEREGETLEEQLDRAVKEERYEDAHEIKNKIEDMKRRMGNWHGSLTIKEADVESIVVTADNLDLVQPIKPYDIEQPDQIRKRHRTRFRNEPGGSDEVFMEGMDGTKNVDKGIGSDQYSDVGCPSSINVAKQKKLVRPTDPNMPNEKMERNPQEEKATTDTWFEWNNMQER